MSDIISTIKFRVVKIHDEKYEYLESAEHTKCFNYIVDNDLFETAKILVISEDVKVFPRSNFQPEEYKVLCSFPIDEEFVERDANEK